MLFSWFLYNMLWYCQVSLQYTIALSQINTPLKVGMRNLLCLFLLETSKHISASKEVLMKVVVS